MKKSLILWLTIMLLTGLFTVACQSNGKENEDGSRVTQTGNGDEEVVGDFVLTISVENATVKQGENFTVNVELKNNSGEDKEIFFDYLFSPTIQGWDLFAEWGIYYDIFGKSIALFEAGSVLCVKGSPMQNNVWEIGSTLEPGTHELRFLADFYLNWGREDLQQIEVWSNTITLIVR